MVFKNVLHTLGFMLFLFVRRIIKNTYKNMAALMVRCTCRTFTTFLLQHAIRTKPKLPVPKCTSILRYFSVLRPIHKSNKSLVALASAFPRIKQSHDDPCFPGANEQQKRQCSGESKRRSLKLMDFKEVMVTAFSDRMRNAFHAFFISMFLDEEFEIDSFMKGAHQVMCM